MQKEHGDDYEPEMPEADAMYLLGYLFEIGPTMISGGYQRPLSHVDIQAWQALVGIELRPWESRYLRRLSVEYLSEGLRAHKANCPAPALELTATRDLAAVAMDLKRSLRAMAGL